jgi:hypothetical protein
MAFHLRCPQCNQSMGALPKHDPSSAGVREKRRLTASDQIAPQPCGRCQGENKAEKKAAKAEAKAVKETIKTEKLEQKAAKEAIKTEKLEQTAVKEAAKEAAKTPEQRAAEAAIQEAAGAVVGAVVGAWLYPFKKIGWFLYWITIGWAVWLVGWALRKVGNKT